VLGAIAYVAYRKANRRNRVSRQNSPETDAVMWFLGGVLVFWPVALAYALHESLNLENKKKYWVMFNVTGFLLMTLIPLGWEVYFLYGFVAAVVVISVAVWSSEDSTPKENTSYLNQDVLARGNNVSFRQWLRRCGKSN
jgi:hypothetical protein